MKHTTSIGQNLQLYLTAIIVILFFFCMFIQKQLQGLIRKEDGYCNNYCCWRDKKEVNYDSVIAVEDSTEKMNKACKTYQKYCERNKQCLEINGSLKGPL